MAVKSTSKKKQVVERKGSTKRSIGIPHYPKRYEVVVEDGAANGGVTIKRTCENMTSWELYGLLRMLLLEIERQMRIKPDEELKLP